MRCVGPLVSTPLRTRNSLRPSALPSRAGHGVTDTRRAGNRHRGEGQRVVAQHDVVGVGAGGDVRDQGVDVEIPVPVGVTHRHRPPTSATGHRVHPHGCPQGAASVQPVLQTAPHRSDQVLVAVPVQVAEVRIVVVAGKPDCRGDVGEPGALVADVQLGCGVAAGQQVVPTVAVHVDDLGTPGAAVPGDAPVVDRSEPGACQVEEQLALLIGKPVGRVVAGVTGHRTREGVAHEQVRVAVAVGIQERHVVAAPTDVADAPGGADLAEPTWGRLQPQLVVLARLHQVLPSPARRAVGVDEAVAVDVGPRAQVPIRDLPVRVDPRPGGRSDSRVDPGAVVAEEPAALVVVADPDILVSVAVVVDDRGIPRLERRGQARPRHGVHRHPRGSDGRRRWNTGERASRQQDSDQDAAHNGGHVLTPETCSL